MKRKNCFITEHTPQQYRRGPCDDNQAGRLRGTDLNRNYPGFWGGAGAAAGWSEDTYRGDSPGDTPEVANVRNLVSHRQVVSLITLHTFGNLLLRPPGVYRTGQPPDEVQYERLGARMAAANHYTNQPSFKLYDTTGSTEDWSTGTPAATGSPSRSAPRASTRPTATASWRSTSAAGPPRVRGTAATARRSTGCRWRRCGPPTTRRSTAGPRPGTASSCTSASSPRPRR